MYVHIYNVDLFKAMTGDNKIYINFLLALRALIDDHFFTGYRSGVKRMALLMTR